MTPKQTVCLLGSPRRDCNSDTLAQYFAEQAKYQGASVETFALSEMTFSGCKNLFRCKTDLTHCGQSDDLTPVLKATAKAQVLVLASPVYFTSITGQLKLAIDRMFSFFVPDYPTAKVKSRLSSGRHVVLLQTQGEPENRYADLLENFSASFTGLGFTHQHHIRAWDTRNPGDIERQERVFNECREVAQKIYANP